MTTECYMCHGRRIAMVSVREESTAQIVDACLTCSDMWNGHGMARVPMTIAEVRAAHDASDHMHPWAMTLVMEDEMPTEMLYEDAYAWCNDCGGPIWRGMPTEHLLASASPVRDRHGVIQIVTVPGLIWHATREHCRPEDVVR